MKKYGIKAASEDNGCEDHRFSSGKGGFSLVELMIAMAVGLVVLAGVYTCFYPSEQDIQHPGRCGGDAAERAGGHGHHGQGNRHGGI